MLRTKHRAFILAIAIAALWSVSAEAQGNWRPGDFGSWRFFMGIFEPTASSQYWDETFEAFSGSASDFEDLVFGTDYLWRTSRHGGVLFGVSFYDGQTTQAYLDWVDLEGNDVGHLTTLGLADVSAAYVVQLGRSSIRPYLGAGGGLLWWRLTEEGSFIDFGDDELPIIFASYRADSTTWELFALAGFDFRLAHRWSFFFEGRYRWADDELNKDFAGFGTIDLSGFQAVGGFSYNF